jgi:hypothetical protein
MTYYTGEIERKISRASWSLASPSRWANGRALRIAKNERTAFLQIGKADCESAAQPSAKDIKRALCAPHLCDWAQLNAFITHVILPTHIRPVIWGNPVHDSIGRMESKNEDSWY